MTVDEILGQGGLMSRALERYEFRPQQLQMANAVAEAFRRRRPLIVEAATGTGKTLAYLVPALLSGKRVVVSTGTKALQEQLFHKDIPFLKEHWPSKFDAVLLKGRRNYLCKLRFEQMRESPSFRTREDARLWPKVLSWAKYTQTGDRAEIQGLPDDYPTWNDLSVGAEACLGQKCPHFEDCHITTVRKQAAQAQIIVVNHHLFFADLAIRDTGFGEILPEFDALVFDEAHHVESVATSYFGMQMSNFRIRELIADITRALENEDVSTAHIDEGIEGLENASNAFFSVATFGLYDGRYSMDEVMQGTAGPMIRPAADNLIEALDVLKGNIQRTAGLGEVAVRLAGRCAEQRSDLAFILDGSDKKYVFFVEVRDKGFFLQAAPIDLAKLLRDKLLNAHDRLIFTSATLATDGNFDFFEERIGIKNRFENDEFPLDRMILAPVFDYENQAIVYVPRRLPAPNHPEWQDGVCTIVEYLIGLTEGRAFVLFTSYANMNQVFEKVAPKIEHKVLKQGEKPKRELLDEFRADTHSVLFATSSFWEGVDVEGEALSLVIIDKLPFASPSDPLTKARLDLIDSKGGSSFSLFSVPSAALTLKQGFGRLIRSKTDRGIVAILDSRIVSKGYGRYFLNSLPPARVAHNASEVKSWWAEHGNPT
ncbi:MAG: ATP-dependent DNA helicase [bacterium]